MVALSACESNVGELWPGMSSGADTGVLVCGHAHDPVEFVVGGRCGD